MTLIDRDLPAAPNNIEGQTPPNAVLGLVVNEPLMSMLKVERTPPPVFISTARPTNTEGTPQSATAFITAQQKLAEAEFRIGLSQLIIRNETAVADSGDQDVIDGFDEVYRFLRNCEHLRILQEN